MWGDVFTIRKAQGINKKGGKKKRVDLLLHICKACWGIIYLLNVCRSRVTLVPKRLVCLLGWRSVNFNRGWRGCACFVFFFIVNLNRGWRGCTAGIWG